MARVTLLWTAEAPSDLAGIKALLAPLGVEVARWGLPAEAAELAARDRLDDAGKERLLALFRDHLDADAEYVDADVVAVRNVPGVDEALAKFDRVHFHDDDEIRAIVGGSGVFGFVHDDGRQLLVDVEPGDYIRVPAGLWHWFYCHGDRNITALRLFKDTSGWVPRYRDTARGTPGPT